MNIIPAIDLIDGKCVRLTEGDFNKKTEYNREPLDVAVKFKKIGVKRVHIVDLDGAKSGFSKNKEIIKRIKKKTGLIVETGGGLRKEDDIKALIDGDIDYLILGTILVENLREVERWIKKYGNKFIAGIDVKNNTVMTRGWMKNEGLEAIDFGRKILDAGIDTAIFTDISRDGNLGGPNVESTKEFIIKTGLKVILSGGISGNNDIIDVMALEEYGLIGIIIGKAFYEGKINLKEAIDKYQD